MCSCAIVHTLQLCGGQPTYVCTCPLPVFVKRQCFQGMYHRAHSLIHMYLHTLCAVVYGCAILSLHVGHTLQHMVEITGEGGEDVPVEENYEDDDFEVCFCASSV